MVNHIQTRLNQLAYRLMANPMYCYHKRRLGPGFGGTKNPQFSWGDSSKKVRLSFCILDWFRLRLVFSMPEQIETKQYAIYRVIL